jgi:hypothetical protein
VVAIKADGTHLFEKQLSISEASSTSLFSCAVSTLGTFALPGGAYDASGRVASFIVFLDKSGATTKIQRTDGFTAFKTIFDTKGGLWAVGIEQGALKKKGDPRDLMIKMFNPDGTIEKSIKIDYPIKDPAQSGPLDRPYVGISATDVVILRKEWRELTFVPINGGPLRRVTFNLPVDLGLVIGFVVTPTRIFLKHQMSSIDTAKPKVFISSYEWSTVDLQWHKLHGDQYSQPHYLLGMHDNFLLAGFKSEHVWIPLPGVR